MFTAFIQFTVQLEVHYLKAAEQPDQSGSCVKYCRPTAAAWECAAFWIKRNGSARHVKAPVVTLLPFL
ncbi:hypothetical protein O3P69_014980 [Scylla paramamosain]|uniref:Uncharacterized protein n=1 Tax=Scylla paramamosain TaxID=85552 RepID=A0AAW0SE19_SCYPA